MGGRVGAVADHHDSPGSLETELLYEAWRFSRIWRGDVNVLRGCDMSQSQLCPSYPIAIVCCRLRSSHRLNPNPMRRRFLVDVPALRPV